MTDGGLRVGCLGGVLRVLGRGSSGVLCCGVGTATKGSSSTARGPDKASKPMLTEAGECGEGVVTGAAQQQAAAEHEPACGRGGCGRGGVCVPVRELSVWGRVLWLGVARAPAQQKGEEGRWCWREAGIV